jgi:hypothetical protein
MKIKNYKSCATALAMLALSAIAQAAPLTGGITIGALSTAIVDTSDVGPTANSVKFNPGPLPGINAIVSSSSGTIAAVAPALTFGKYENFTYAPLSVVNPIWTLGFLTFDLTSITSISEPTAGVVLTGTGVLKALGYSNTAGLWSFSANTTDGAVFSWSSTTNAGVPDGGTSMSMLGLSLLGLAGVSRKLRKK